MHHLGMPIMRRRYERADKPASSYEADILRHMDAAEDVMAENATEGVKYLLVDCGALQQTLVNHANLWASRYKDLLLSVASKGMLALQRKMADNLHAARVRFVRKIAFAGCNDQRRTTCGCCHDSGCLCWLLLQVALL